MHHPSVRVWDWGVRLSHWLVALAFALNISETVEAGERWQRWLGYGLLSLVAWRIVWGFVGSPYARFRQFVPRPTEFWQYLQAKRRGQAAHYVGHNPAGALMILCLWLGLLVVGLSGWLLTTDLFWGSEWLEEGHEAAAYAVLGLVVIHVSAVFLESRHQRENLITAMITGRKRQR